MLSLFCPVLEYSGQGVGRLLKSCTAQSWRGGKNKREYYLLLLQLTSDQLCVCVCMIKAGKCCLDLNDCFVTEEYEI